MGAARVERALLVGLSTSWGETVLRRITAVATIYRYPRGVDENGYPLATSEYESWPSEAWPIYSIQPRELLEEFSRGRRTVTAGIRVSAPIDGPRPEPDDVVVLPGFEAGGGFDVDGEVAVWDNNPILSQTKFAGIVVNLERRRR